MTLSPAQLRDLLDRHDLAPSRALGQNFVVDAGTIDKVVRLARIERGDCVLEIGPGVGSLTVALAHAGASVLAVEHDRHLLPALREVLAGAVVPAVDDQAGPIAAGSVRIVHGDATTIDWKKLLAPASAVGESAGSGPWKLVSNLPYNIATGLILDLLTGVPEVCEQLVMVQREVADRLAASAGSRTYGIPSVVLAYYATAEVVAKVSSSVFVPRPRVDSALLRVVRHEEPPVSADPERLFALVRAGFGQRRKMLRRSLGHLVPSQAWEAAGVDPQARPEQLGLGSWARLERAVTAGER